MTAKNPSQLLHIEGIPPNLNVYRNMHFHEKNTLKIWWNDHVKDAIEDQGIQPVNGPVSIMATFHFNRRVRHDPDNYCACLKWINDAIVNAGVLQDDSFEHIPLLSVRQGAFIKGKPYVTLLLQEETPSE